MYDTAIPSELTAISLVTELDICNTGWSQCVVSDELTDVHSLWQNMPREYGSDRAFDGGWMDHEEFTLLNADEYTLVVQFLTDRMAALRAAGKKMPLWGRCTACGAIEVELKSFTGTVDYSAIGESAQYPIGYGCELCS